MMKKILASVVAAFFATAAYGQSAGTVTNHAYAIGKGPGVTGYTSLLCASGQLAIGSATDPTCRTMSGDATVNATGVLTLATVNANVGTFGSATACVTVTANAKGLTTAISAATCTPAIGNITGLAAGVATWLGAPSSANLRAAVTDETGTGLAYFQGGDIGTPSAGVGTNLTGTAAGLTAGTVTTNANLTGPVTSVGNATAVTNNAITNAMIRQGIARSVIGVTGNAGANVADIQGTANQLLVVNPAGTALTFGPIRLDGGAASLAGNLPVANLNSGTNASATTFWRGDATWGPGAWGTYVPAPACGTGVFTVNTAHTQQIGKTTFVELDITLTTVGTCATVLTFTGPAATLVPGTALLRESVNSGNFFGCSVNAASNSWSCSRLTGTAAINDRYIMSAVYEAS